MGFLSQQTHPDFLEIFYMEQKIRSARLTEFFRLGYVTW